MGVAEEDSAVLLVSLSLYASALVSSGTPAQGVDYLKRSEVRLYRWPQGLVVSFEAQTDVLAPMILAMKRDLAKQGQVNRIESNKGSEVTYLMLNSSKPPFDDPLARQIVIYSRNTAQINQIRNHDLFPLASGPFPPGSSGYLKDTGFPKPDPKKARALERIGKP